MSECSGEFELRAGEKVIGTIGEWTLIYYTNKLYPIHGNSATDLTHGQCSICGAVTPKAMEFLAKMEK